jgi:hypothetical protein
VLHRGRIASKAAHAGISAGIAALARPDRATGGGRRFRRMMRSSRNRLRRGYPPHLTGNAGAILKN